MPCAGLLRRDALRALTRFQRPNAQKGVNRPAPHLRERTLLLNNPLRACVKSFPIPVSPVAAPRFGARCTHPPRDGNLPAAASGLRRDRSFLNPWARAGRAAPYSAANAAPNRHAYSNLGSRQYAVAAARSRRFFDTKPARADHAHRSSHSKFLDASTAG